MGATLLVFVTRKLYKQHGAKVFLPILAMSFVSEYNWFNGIIMGVWLAECKQAHNPHVLFKVCGVLSCLIVVISLCMWDKITDADKLGMLPLKHGVVPFAACATLSAFVHLETWMNAHAQTASQTVHIIVCQGARLTFMMYLLHLPIFYLLEEHLDYTQGTRFPDYFSSDRWWKYWFVYWPVLIVVTIICTLSIDEPFMRAANKYRSQAASPTAQVAPADHSNDNVTPKAEIEPTKKCTKQKAMPTEESTQQEVLTAAAKQASGAGRTGS